jgi:hypothetical protein
MSKPRKLTLGKGLAQMTYDCWVTSEGTRVVNGFQWEPRTARDLVRLAAWCVKAAAWLKEK